jgi:YD repeat-containing protein
MSDRPRRREELLRHADVRSYRAVLRFHLSQWPGAASRQHVSAELASSRAPQYSENRGFRRSLATAIGRSCLKWLFPLISCVALGATTTNYSYDDQGRLATSNFDNGKSVVYKLDAAGNRTQVQLSTDTTPPSVPTALAGTAVSGSQINLTWAASTDNVGVTGYTVYRNGVQVGIPGATSFSDTGLSGYTLYTYTVAARDAANNISAASSPGVSVRTLDTVPPSAPGVPTITNIASTTATASWSAATDNAGVTSYDYKLDQGTWIGIGNVLTKNLSGLTVGTPYTFYVRAHDAAGNIGAASSKAFTTSAYVDTGTINIVTATVPKPEGSITLVGFSSHGGSMTPTSTSNGHVYVAFYDRYNLEAIYEDTRFSVGGFATDPGQAWLVSAAVAGLGSYPGATAAYTYSSGIATWIWPTRLFLVGGTPTFTITHY